MIVILSNALDATADFFEERLRNREVAYLRLHTEDFPSYSLRFAVHNGKSAGTIQGQSRSVYLEDITSVYYRRPKPPELPHIDDPGLRLWLQNEFRQAWGGILMSVPAVRWVNHPIAIGGASFKPEQVARAARLGLHVPDTLVTSDPAAALVFCEAHAWEIVVKPVGHGEIRGEDPAGDRIVYTNLIDESHRSALADLRNCPTLFQQWIQKQYDVRATVVGDECIAVALHSQDQEVSQIDCRRDNMLGMRYSIVDLPSPLINRLLSLTRSYSLHYAAVDLALDRSGRYWFLELNAAGQWAWLEQLAGAPISDALIRCLANR